MFDNLQFAFVGGLRVNFLAFEQRAAQSCEFVHHAKQIGSASARGIADFDAPQGVENLFGIANPRNVFVVHERREGICRLSRFCEVMLQRLPTHERDDGTRRVITAGLVPSRYEFLEHLTEHFGINGDLDIERRGFRHGKVVSLEQVENGGESVVRNVDDALLVERRHLEQSAVQERDDTASLDEFG